MKTIFLIILLFSFTTWAQNRSFCQADLSIKKNLEACRLSYQVLSGLEKGKSQKTVPLDLNISAMEQAIVNGQVQIDNNQEYGALNSNSEKQNYLFKQMLEQSGQANRIIEGFHNQVPNKKPPASNAQSGTRGGGFELPSNWWIWH